MSEISTSGGHDTLNALKVQNWFVGFITKPSIEVIVQFVIIIYFEFLF